MVTREFYQKIGYALIFISGALIVTSFLLLTTPGRTVPIYLLVAGIAAISTLVSEFYIRVMAVVMVGLALALAMNDHSAGLIFVKRTTEMRQGMIKDAKKLAPIPATTPGPDNSEGRAR